MAEKQYKVTAPCVVHVPVSTSDGPMLGTFYKDAILPSDVPEEKVKHLLDSNLIEEVGGFSRNTEAKQQPGRGRKPAEQGTAAAKSSE